MSAYTILVIVHVVLFAYWLGGDWGVYVNAKYVADAKLPLEATVCEVWPEFAGGGKRSVSFHQVLSHTAGLFALDRPTDIQDYAAVVNALEEQAPLFPIGTRQAYHARTFGFLVDEIVRRKYASMD